MKRWGAGQLQASPFFALLALTSSVHSGFKLQLGILKANGQRQDASLPALHGVYMNPSPNDLSAPGPGEISPISQEVLVQGLLQFLYLGCGVDRLAWGWR